MAAEEPSCAGSTPVRAVPLWHGPFAGAVSGILARLILFPADTVKARLQVSGAVSPSLSRTAGIVSASAALYRSEGIGGFYRGFAPVLMGVIPAQAAYFVSSRLNSLVQSHMQVKAAEWSAMKSARYELGKRLMPPSLGILSDMGTGCIAQLIAGVAFTPVDILKERFQVQTMMQGRIAYTGAGQAIWSIISTQGLPGLMRGYWATNCVWIPWNIMYIASFEELKRASRAQLHLQDGDAMPALATAASSMTAATIAAVATHPADVIKTRLQVLTATETQAVSAASITRDLLGKEGFRALWSGLGARCIVLAPGAALTWVLYEEVKGRLAAHC